MVLPSPSLEGPPSLLFVNGVLPRIHEWSPTLHLRDWSSVFHNLLHIEDFFLFL
ncbi:Hypothetical protein FKW44_007883 [Caligus rogercresseyi]|uniref:Uncharacterized protein n=1 Tax=Caligus rogercresseyi TaxID=217165 RepID=A0A7T8KFI2_CALRO|nr:Hypothetical protein FKW44_007883 [Caligus rogercresseyi]